ncbi:MAG: helix-turn-helix domain-containing protein [Rhodobacteraceae bacterium]|nr:helix-turn-helix domain-containing protein [Paracoccaceae bacterium]
MSHFATNWAIQQRGLKPTTKIVLWHLCDRFNPDYGCFPSQRRLAHDCEISRSTLNLHLDQLEATGLLRRVPSIDPVTKRQKPTRYILGFEIGYVPDGTDPCPNSGHGPLPFDEECRSAAETPPETVNADQPCPETGHGAVSDFYPDPCPKNSQSRVRNPDTNLVREPLREPVKEEEDAQAREADFDLFFAELLKALGQDPNGPLPAWWKGQSARENVRSWRDDLGLSEDRIIDTASETRRDHPAPPDGPKALDRFMERAAQREAQTATSGVNRQNRKPKDTPRRDPGELAVFYADLVNSDRYLPSSMIGNAMRDAMLARGLVTPERLRLRGVQ